MNEWKLLPGKRPPEGPPPWYDLPEFFPSCPHCGASCREMNWPHLILQHDYPWKRLDGYVGETDMWQVVALMSSETA